MLSTNNWEMGIDFPSEVCYTPPDLGWKEKIYAVVVMGYPSTPRIHGVTKNLNHAKQVAKEVGGYVEETGWLDPP